MKYHSNIIGIDIGAKGALAHINKTNSIELVKIIPFNLKEYISYLKSINLNDIDLFIIEKIHSMRNQGVKSMFSFGTRYGEVLGMLETLDIPNDKILLLEPRVWQKNLLNEITKDIDIKYQVFNKVYELFDNELLLKPRSKKPNTDISDSIGIALSALNV